MAILPKIGDPIPGTNLFYEESDIQNLQSAPPPIQSQQPGVSKLPDVSKLPTGTDLGTIGGEELLKGGAISSDTLSEQPKTDFETKPQPSPTPDVKGIDTTFALTEPEQKAEGLIGELGRLEEGLIGESAFRLGEEKRLDVEGLRKTQQDLSSRLKALQNEALAIPLRMQEEAKGRGITAQGLAPIEASALRKNAIQALSISALFEAAKGNLTLAQDQIDRATEARFAPIREKIAVKERNLDRIIRSPAYSLADKNRALEAQKRLNAEMAENDKKESNMKSILESAKDAAASGRATSVQLEEIRRLSENPIDENVIEATRFASKFISVKPEVLDTSIVEIGGRKQLVNLQTGEIIRDLGIADIEPTPPIITPEGQPLIYGTPEYVEQKLLNTASSKTKPVASEREQLGKFANVIALTDNLMTSLNKTTNDPILGYLKSLNPYDFDARAVNAQVTALVPSVARALYGEVGVLTDTDIERYLKTLPNIRSTDEQNKFIALMTLANAKRSYEQTLLNLANSNVNVSGFVDSYKNVVNKVDSLEEELKVGAVEISGEDEAIFDSVIEEPEKEGYFSRLWKALMGR